MNAPAATAIAIDWTWVVAVYGALIATVVLGWDIWKWARSGPRLAVDLSTGMTTINFPRYEGKDLFLLNVTNRGDRPTTITHVTLNEYSNLWHYLRRRPKKSFLVNCPNVDFPIPHVLHPGAVWVGIGEQTPDFESMATGLLYVGLFHSHSKREILRRVVLRPKAKSARATAVQ